MDGDFNVAYWSRGAAALNQRLCLLRSNGTTDTRFLAYALPAHLQVINDLTYATTVKHLSSGQVRGIRMDAPDLSEQCAIADYLDRETARIDTLIEEQQRLIDLLHERREAEVDEALRSPSEARHTIVKRVLQPLARPAVSGLGVVTAFRDGIVTLRSNRREEGYTFSNTENGYQEVRPGDLVFHALDGFAGAVGVSDSTGNATPVYHVCVATAGDDLVYLAQLLRYLGRSGFLATQAPNVRERSVDFRNWSMFGRLPLVLPPVDAQRRIAAHLDEQTAKVDQLVTETERFIELARERREALITAAVTGQIDVREMA
jgi:type I restriction enzyme S subunit